MIDHFRIPDAVQVCRRPEKRDTDIIAPAVSAIADMQGLVQIANDVNRKSEGEDFLVARALGVEQGLAKRFERAERIAFRWRPGLLIG
jgi:hypothetical protein